ncbi:MAG: carbamoyltransferase HypF [Saprospiraceae bacterium]
MTYHIHIQGIVQGVGFRLFIYKLALQYNLVGTVSNGNDGVNIFINCDEEKKNEFVRDIRQNAPAMSVITSLDINIAEDKLFESFEIVESTNDKEPDLLLAPDFSMCSDCREDIYSAGNKRYHYVFTTCTNCGPRFSIINALPYDRENTAMEDFAMCPECKREYNDVMDRRYFSQTNSCPICGVRLEIYGGSDSEIYNEDDILDYVVEQLANGNIASIKGIGGFLTICDAANEEAVNKLRKRKNRPDKPLALMYPDMSMIENDTFVSESEAEELKSIWSPIVLLKFKENIAERIYVEGICKGLDRVGIMLPYTPLFDILLNKFKKPIIATSGNISGSTIIYDNEKAKIELMKISDLLLLNNRDIIIPQDDSVIKFSSENKKRIVIRRSRGIAPSYIDSELQFEDKRVLSMGAMLKSVFAILNKKQIYISQFLGNTDIYDSQLNYKSTLDHFIGLLKFTPEVVVIDKHPAYFSHIFGRELSLKYNAEIVQIQHHIAHFAAVLGEYNLHRKQERVLGVVFDGTGYGDDGNIWGGEFFIYDSEIIRVEHIPYFNFILGDKMVREPRISALTISKYIGNLDSDIEDKFTDGEYKIYNSLLDQEDNLKSSSMGRVFDAVASILFGVDFQTFEGQAAMILEAEAQSYFDKFPDYDLSYIEDNIDVDDFLRLVFNGVIRDKKNDVSEKEISSKFHISVVDYIIKEARKFNVNKIAFSGGVFQNGIIVDLINRKLPQEYEMYFHKHFSPNDECIAFGQVIARELIPA